MIKRLFAFLAVSVFLLVPILNVSALEVEDVKEQVVIEVFERQDCKHCKDQKAFFDKLVEERDDIVINYYDLVEEENDQLFTELAEVEGISKVTPTTLIGDRVLQGFDDEETTGELIRTIIDNVDRENQYSFRSLIDAGGSGEVTNAGVGCDENGDTCDPSSYEPFLVKIPFMGPVDVKQYSLPVMSLILGFIDGFNPCAMWVLVTFLIVLVQIGDRKKMWQIAGLFILAEAIMYYLILNVWMHVWDFVGLDHIVTIIVGIVAIGGGLFFLYEWKTNDGTCKVTNSEQKKKTTSKINKIVQAEMTIATVIAVLGLALSVNIIEFACSIGIPQAYTKILELNNLGWLYEQFNMLLYILMYMVDDFIVFGIALYSIEKIGVTQKYAKWCNLIGGILMLILGAILVFKPELLVL